MMKKLVALLMALALLCTSIGAFAEEEGGDPVALESAGTQHEGPHTAEANSENVIKEATCLEPGVAEYKCSVCKQIFSKELPTLDHVKASDYAVDSKAPTCSEEGWQEFECANKVDGKTHTFKITLNKTEHEVKEVVTEATCTEPKTIVQTCKNCDWTKTITQGEALGHKWTNTEAGAALVGEDDLTLEKTEPATCKKAGYTANYYYCAVCGVYSDETANEVTEIPQLKHDFVNGGYFTYEGEGDDKVCIGGKDGEIVVAVDPEIYQEYRYDSTNQSITVDGQEVGCILYEEKAPTCTEDGFVRVTCKICGDTKEETLKAPGHDWELNTSKSSPNCVTDGKEVYECSVCHETYQTTIKCRGGHVCDEDQGSTVKYYQGNFLNKKEVEVAKEDLVACFPYTKEVFCNNPICDYSKKEVVNPAEGTKHEKGTVIESKAATCTEGGYVLYQCTKCKQPVWDTTEALKHSWDAGKITTAATCTDDGIKTYTCTRTGCKETKTEVIPTAGHTKIKITDELPTCTKKGLYEEKCLACGEVLKSEVREPKHTYSLAEADKAEILHYVPETCTTKGEISYYCHICHTYVDKEVIPALEHDWTEWTVTKQPSCEHLGEEQRTCNRCYNAEDKNPVGIETRSFGELLPHTYTEGYSKEIPTKVATCTEEGEFYYECDVCHKMDRKTTPALGHDYYKTVDGQKVLNIEWIEETNSYVLKCTREGCTDPVKTIEAHETEYAISKKDGKGVITLKDDCQPLAGDVYVRIMWRYKFESGDTFAYVDCRPVTLDETLKTGTFKLSGGQTSATLIATAVEVVTDPDADSKIMGGNNYDVYGSDVL